MDRLRFRKAAAQENHGHALGYQTPLPLYPLCAPCAVKMRAASHLHNLLFLIGSDPRKAPHCDLHNPHPPIACTKDPHALPALILGSTDQIVRAQIGLWVCVWSVFLGWRFLSIPHRPSWRNSGHHRVCRVCQSRLSSSTSSLRIRILCSSCWVCWPCWCLFSQRSSGARNRTDPRLEGVSYLVLEHWGCWGCWGCWWGLLVR